MRSNHESKRAFAVGTAQPVTSSHEINYWISATSKDAVVSYIRRLRKGIRHSIEFNVILQALSCQGIDSTYIEVLRKAGTDRVTGIGGKENTVP